MEVFLADRLFLSGEIDSQSRVLYQRGLKSRTVNVHVVRLIADPRRRVPGIACRDYDPVPPLRLPAVSSKPGNRSITAIKNNTGPTTRYPRMRSRSYRTIFSFPDLTTMRDSDFSA